MMRIVVEICVNLGLTKNLPCTKAKAQQGGSEQNMYPCTQSPLRAFERL